MIAERLRLTGGDVLRSRGFASGAGRLVCVRAAARAIRKPDVLREVSVAALPPGRRSTVSACGVPRRQFRGLVPAPVPRPGVERPERRRLGIESMLRYDKPSDLGSGGRTRRPGRRWATPRPDRRRDAPRTGDGESNRWARGRRVEPAGSETVSGAGGLGDGEWSRRARRRAEVPERWRAPRIRKRRVVRTDRRIREGGVPRRSSKVRLIGWARTAASPLAAGPRVSPPSGATARTTASAVDALGRRATAGAVDMLPAGVRNDVWFGPLARWPHATAGMTSAPPPDATIRRCCPAGHPALLPGGCME
jgi:hypothetical protein